MIMNLCKDCGKQEVFQRKRCKDCLKVYNYAKAYKSYLLRKRENRLKRYGKGYCAVCKREMILNNPSQKVHRECYSKLSLVKKPYNSFKRNKKGKMIARAIVEERIGNIPEDYVVHHLNGDVDNNDLCNLMLLRRKDHSILHSYLRKLKINWLKDNTEEIDNWEIPINEITKEWIIKNKIEYIEII